MNHFTALLPYDGQVIGVFFRLSDAVAACRGFITAVVQDHTGAVVYPMRKVTR